MEPFSNLEVFNKNNAAQLLNICWGVSVWCQNDTPLPDLVNFKLIKTFQGWDTFGFCYRNICALYYSTSLNMIIVFFAGTVHISEWLDDFDFLQVNPTNITSNNKVFVHGNMYKLYDTLRVDLIKEIKSLMNDDTVFVSTGHSLGGALSTICYFDIVTNNVIKIRTLYSIASPRVGNVEFANILNTEKTVFRIANSEDIATTVPLPIVGDSIYSHFSNCISFSINEGKTYLNHGDAYTQFFAN